MKKKAIVVISVIVFLVGLLLLLSFTVFSLKSVEVDYRTSRTHITVSDEEIIESAKFKMGSSVLFQGKKGYAKNIENLNPYIKVVNIETVYPSSFVVHIAERQEVYAIEFENGHYICDETFRILRIDEEYKSDTTNAILLNFSTSLSENQLKEGEYIQDIETPPIYQALFENNRTLAEQSELIESITISTELDSITNKEQTVATLNLFSGQDVRIINTRKGLIEKIKLMLDVHCQLFDYLGKTLNTPSGEVVLTEQHLKTCTIEINNYLHPSHNDSECYFNIILK